MMLRNRDKSNSGPSPREPGEPEETAGLARAFDLNRLKRATWNASDLPAIWSHHLDSPIAAEVAAVLGDEAGGAAARAAVEAKPLITTFGDLLRHAAPPEPLLRMTKEYTKASRKYLTLGIPAPLVEALYLAVVIKARGQGFQVSRIEADALRKGIEWMVAQRWLDTATRTMIEAWRDREAG